MSGKKVLKWVVAISLSVLCVKTAKPESVLRVGILETRNPAAKQIKQTLQENGFEAGLFQLSSGRTSDQEITEIYNYDVLFIGGGRHGFDWLASPVFKRDPDGSRVRYPTHEDRMHLLEFVERRGGGVVFSMFSCGTTGRSMIRPVFPEIAHGYNKVHGRGTVVVEPEHPVMKGLPSAFINPYWDHTVLELGPDGLALAMNTCGDINIACGKAGYGRAVFIGPWIGINVAGRAVYPLPETDKQLLINSIRWAGASQHRDRSGSTEISDAIRKKVLREERFNNWTRAVSGRAQVRSGLLTSAKNAREQELDDLFIRVKRYAPLAEDAETARRIVALMENIVHLQDELRANHKQAVILKQREISMMTLEALEQHPALEELDSGRVVNKRDQVVEEWRNRLLLPHRVAGIINEVRSLEDQLEPELEAYNARQFARSIEEDRKNIPVLVDALKSVNTETRARAALELGRIGEPGRALIGAPPVVKALVEALGDPEYDVCRNAIYALSWMQSAEAVPALTELLKTSDHLPTRRRAAQALGQIGDAKAIDALLNTAENDDDAHARHNALLALGWIGDSKAVAPLIGIAENLTARFPPPEENGEQENKKQADEESDVEDEESADDRANDMFSLMYAVRALGNIGDPAALPFLENNRTPIHARIYRDRIRSGRLDPVDFVAEAIEHIKAGGRGERGVSQMEVLSERDHFYWMSGRYNALYGRYTSWRYEPADSDKMLSYAAFSGGSGTVEFNTFEKWIGRQPDIDIDRHFDWASSLGLKINTQMPTMPHRANKALYERELARFGGHPSFGGFWLEENVSLDGRARAGGDEPFRQFLQSRYTTEKLAEMGIDDIESVTIPEPDSPAMWRIYQKDGARADKFVFAEYLEYAADIGADNWSETQEWVAGLRKGTKLSFSMSARFWQGGSTFISGYPRINQALDAGGPQSYSEHSSVNNFELDMHVDGEPRPAQGEYYAHQADTPGRVERGFASSFVYGQQFFVHGWHNIFKHPGEHGNWEAAIRQFSKGRAISEYLAPRETRGAGLLTQLYSGRTATLTYADGAVDGHGGGGKTDAENRKGGVGFRYTQNQQAFWEAMVRSHLPVEMTWLETQHPEKLAGYKVAILADAVSIDKREVEMIRDWVRGGGILIATAPSTLHDQWDRKQDNYMLADVFGVDYVRTGGEPSLIYVERDLKPETGVSDIRMTEPEYFLHMEGAVSAGYEKAIGYNVVKPTTARTVAVWDDGETPAVLENQYGEGYVIFITACYPALSHWTRGWTVRPLYKKYWPGMRELLAACVRRGLELTGTELPLEVENCPETVDVALKRQEQNNRWMAHLLNIDEKNGLIQDVRLTVRPPSPVKSVYYAYPERVEADYTETDTGIELIVRPFDVHEMVVIEWEQ